MLSKKQRLPIQKTVSARPERIVRGGGLTLKVFASNLSYGRFGVIIPKAVAPTAVLRNRLKRAAFEGFRGHRGAMAGGDVLCLLTKGAPVTKDGMMSELAHLLAKL